MVAMLLKYNADPNASVRPDIFQPPLDFLIDLWLKQRYIGWSRKLADFVPQLMRPLLEKMTSADANTSATYNSLKFSLEQVSCAYGSYLRSEAFELSKILIEAGAPVEPLSAQWRFTALQNACDAGNLELVKLLLEHNAKINASADQDFVPSPDSGYTGSPLQSSVYSPDIFNLLLEKGANINEPPASMAGRTALQGVAELGDISRVKRLIKLGADVNQPGSTYHGRTALQAAAAEGHLSIVHLLLEHGADVNALASIKGYTALEAGARFGRLDITQLLINVGADTHLPGSQRYRTAEKQARYGSHVVVANLLKDCFEDAPWD